MRRTRRAIGTLTLSLLCSALGGCTPKESGANEGGVCDGVAGSCMDLLIAGSGSYSKLELTLGKPNGLSPQIISGGSIPPVPYHVRIVPPAGTKTSEFSAITARALNTSNSIEQAKIDGISWPDASHVAYSLNLQPSNTVPFSRYASHAAFTAPASDIIAGDFDKDGKMDVAAAIWETSSINVVFGDGTGSLGALFSVATDIHPAEIKSADLDRDSYLDLVTTNYEGRSVTSFLNKKSRSFVMLQRMTNANAPAYLALDDINGDGIVDIAHQVTSSMGTSWTEYRWGRGDGKFGSQAGTESSSTSQGTIHIADMNGDGLKDLVIGGNTQNSNTIFIIPYDGKGFITKTNLITNAQGLKSTRTTFLWVADMNNDLAKDIAALNIDAISGANAVEIMINGGDGLGYSTAQYSAGSKPARITGADIDLDGSPELIVSNNGEDSVSIFYINKAGAVSRILKLGVGGQPSCVITADLNQDKRPDLIVCSGNGVDVFLNTTL